MKKLKALTMLLFTAAILAACDSSDSSDSDYGATYGGWVYDVTTGSQITDYEIFIDTANQRYKGSVNKEGKFSIDGVPYNADYRVTVSADNYTTFYSTNLKSDTEVYDAEDNDSGEVYSESVQNNSWEINLRYVPMVPATVTSTAFTANIYDQTTGNRISSGNYKLVRGDLSSNISSIGGSSSIGTWTQDANIVGGSFTEGTITVNQGELLYGYKYSIQIFNSTGYYDNLTSTTFDPMTYNSNSPYSITLTPINEDISVSLIAVNVLDADLEPVELSLTRQVIFTFNQSISILPDWGIDTHGNPETYLDGQTFLTISSTTNTDNDGSTITMSAEGNTASGVSQWITPTVSGNQLIITIASDTTILDTNDTDDDLTYSLQGLANLYLAPAGGASLSSSSNYVTLESLLNTFSGLNTLPIIIRNTSED